jgi:dTDP-4-dehydrorhamnose reductase
MKILVLGSQGQLGRCLQDQLSASDHEVTYHGRADTDITNFSETSNRLLELRPDVVINASAYTAVDTAETEQSLADQINHLAVGNLAKSCEISGSFLIHVSTDYVFDGNAAEPYTEDDQTNPQTVYGASKLAGEIAIQRSGGRFVIIRTAWVFSEYGKNFFKTMLRLGAERESLSIVGDQIGCPTYAQDIGRLIVELLSKIDGHTLESGVYHYCGDTPCSWYQFAEEIFSQAKQLGYSVPEKILSIATEDYPTPAKRPPYSVLSCTKIQGVSDIGSSNWRLAIGDALAVISSI